MPIPRPAVLAAVLLAFAMLVPVQPAWAQEAVIETASYRGPRGLDPTHGSSTPDRQLLSNIFSGLVRYERDGTGVRPDLARSWEVSDDGRVYTFHLRDDVLWHGGYGPFTAHDVKFTYERILDPDTGSRWRTVMGVIEAIDVLDDHTVRITLDEPSASFLPAVLANMAGYVMNEQAIQDAGDELSFRPIGTGPYRFVSFEPRQRVVLEAFPDFYRGEPEVKRAVWNVIPDASVQALALQSGDLNYLVVTDLEIVGTLRDAPGVSMTATPASGYYGYVFNTRRAPLDDVRVRQAIAHAVDEERFVQTVLEGQGEVARSVIPAGMFGHDPSVTGFPYDPDRARELLAEAGHPDGFTIDVLYNAADGYISPLALVLQQWLGDVGIEVELVGVDNAAVKAIRGAGDFDVHVSGPTRADPDEILSERFHSDGLVEGGTNQSAYTEVDDLIEAQRRAVDPAERAEILAEIQRRIAHDVPELPVYAPIYVTAYADYVEGDMPNRSNWIVWLEPLRITDLDGCPPCR